jgi:hypothetical protein
MLPEAGVEVLPAAAAADSPASLRLGTAATAARADAASLPASCMSPRGVLGRRLGGASRNALGVASGNGTWAALLTRLLDNGMDTLISSCCCCCWVSAAPKFRVGILVVEPGREARRSS